MSSRRLEEVNKTSRLSDNISISIYKSPDVVIFTPQLIEGGQKLTKNHVKRIAVEGKPVVVVEKEVEEVVEEEGVEMTPLEKYFELKKKLNIAEYSSLVEVEGNEEVYREEIVVCTVQSQDLSIVEQL